MQHAIFLPRSARSIEIPNVIPKLDIKVVLSDFIYSLPPKVILAATSLFSGFGLIADSNPALPKLEYPQTLLGWLAVVATISLAILSFLDRRRIAEADTFTKIIRSKDALITNLENSEKAWQKCAQDWEDEFKLVKEDLDAHRKMHHQFVNEVNPKLMKLSTENVRMSSFLAEQGLSLPEL